MLLWRLEAAVENKDGDELASKRPPPGDGVVITVVSIPPRPRPLRRLDEAAVDVNGGYG